VEIPREFVVPRGDPPPILNGAKEVLDTVPTSIDVFGTPCFLFRVAFGWDRRQRAIIPDRLSYLFTVVSLVRRHRERGPRCREYCLDRLTVVHLTAGDHEVQRPALSINDRVYL
jgi:hypothetical protein